MPTRSTILLTLLLAFAGGVCAQTSAFTYQGRITDNITPQPTTYDLEFALYTAGGTIVGNAIQRNGTAVNNGVFTVTLDFGTLPFSGDARLLEIRVKRPGEPGYTALSPRQPIRSAPYAVRALSAQGVDFISGAAFSTIPFLGGNIANLPPGANWVFLGGPANLSVEDGDLMVITGSATLAHTSSTIIPISINLCYRPTGGNITPLRADGEDLVDIDLKKANFTINYANVSLPAGTYDIGFCGRNQALGTLNQNGKATGWVMKYR